MTIYNIIGTIAGGFIFPFMISFIWGKLVEAFGPIGGWMAAAFVVGTVWSLNHGWGLIFQSGTAWVDMAWAAAIGLFLADLIGGKKIKWSTLIAGPVAGLLGGFLLATVLMYK